MKCEVHEVDLIFTTFRVATNEGRKVWHAPEHAELVISLTQHGSQNVLGGAGVWLHRIGVYIATNRVLLTL